MLGRRFAVVSALALTLGASASAQQFPSDEFYRPWPCDTGVMTDPLRDESGAVDEKDLIGDDAAPTALRAADSDFLYVRLRVDGDPAPGGKPRPWAWGLLIDTGGDAGIYEAMLVADGGLQKVSIYKNTSGTPGDPNDPPDQPVFREYSWSARARTVTAPDSTYAGNTDYFVEMAFSWTDLAPLGIGPATPVRVWAATATNSISASNGLNGDFACRAGVDPTLSASWPATALDPFLDSDGDGFSDAVEVQAGTDPYDANSHPAGGGDLPHLAGGGGCTHGTAGLVALAALVPLLVRAARRRRTGA